MRLLSSLSVMVPDLPSTAAALLGPAWRGNCAFYQQQTLAMMAMHGFVVPPSATRVYEAVFQVCAYWNDEISLMIFPC